MILLAQGAVGMRCSGVNKRMLAPEEKEKKEKVWVKRRRKSVHGDGGFFSWFCPLPPSPPPLRSFPSPASAGGGSYGD